MRPSVVLVISLVLALALVASEAILLAEAEYESSSVRPMSRFLLRSVARTTGCQANPTICSAHGSPGRACCRDACVNFLSDGHNCGKCGHKCNYQQACCGGKCVDLHHDRNHCGKCNNKCKKGVPCSHGMCGYA